MNPAVSDLAERRLASEEHDRLFDQVREEIEDVMRAAEECRNRDRTYSEE